MRSLGIYIEMNAPYLGSMQFFMTLFFDLNEILLSVFLLMIYSSQQKKLLHSIANPLAVITFLNAAFFRHSDILVGVVYSTILIDTIFLPTWF